MARENVQEGVGAGVVQLPHVAVHRRGGEIPHEPHMQLQPPKNHNYSGPLPFKRIGELFLKKNTWRKQSGNRKSFCGFSSNA